MSEELIFFSFQNAFVKILNITENLNLTNNAAETLNPVDKTIFKYKNHVSILASKTP